MTRLQDVLDYMRFNDLDLTEDEKAREMTVVRALMSGAVEYLRNAGIPEPGDEEISDLYDLCVKGMTLHWYDHRDDVGDEAAMPVGIRRVVTQLKLLGRARAFAEGDDDAG